MIEQWSKLAERYDSMSLRERVLVAAGFVVVTVYMSYFLLIDPLVAAKPRLLQAIKQERAMLKAVETIIVPQPGQTADDDAVKRAYMDALAKQIADLNAELQGMQKGLVPPDQMAKLLEGMIVQVRGVDLIAMRKLPVQRVRGAGKAPAAPAEAAAGAPDKPVANGGVYQHGYEITIQGSYSGLHDYLTRLEKLPWRMIWGRLALDAEKHPEISLRLTVHTLSLDRTWLTI